MATSSDLVFYYSPQSRAETVLWMLEELGEPYDTRVLSLARREHKRPEYLAVNPMGKVPTIVHQGIVVTESPAICLYLADAFPQAELSIPLVTPVRGSYLRWLFFVHGCVEPAVLDRMLEREPGPPGSVGYGTVEQTIEVLSEALTEGPYLLGEQFTAADVVLGACLRWAIVFTNTVPPQPVLTSYLERLASRPALQRAMALSAEMQAELNRQYAAEAED